MRAVWMRLVRPSQRYGPKVIWSLWLQGLEEAPDLVRACLTSWANRNPGWIHHILTRDTLPLFLPEARNAGSLLARDLPPAALSDVVRVELLSRFGGVWVDATCYCLQPLDDWLAEAMSAGFFAFSKPGPDRMLSSWFLSSEPASPVLRAWKRRMEAFWRQRLETEDYFWFHHLFELAYNEDPSVRATWEAVPKISADGPHCFSPYDENLLGPIDSDRLRIVETAKTPVLKLTHKIHHSRGTAGTAYRYFCNRELPVINAASRKSSCKRESRVVLCWYGTLQGHGTIGDLYAVQSVAARLQARGISFAHATANASLDISGPWVDPDAVDPADYDTLVFTCGPIIRGHPMVESLLQRFGGLRKIGVSVSIFPNDHASHAQPFDHLLAREGQAEAFGDVAILAPLPSLDSRSTARSRSMTIGLAMRGPQGEYGLERDLSDQAQSLAVAVCDALGGPHRLRIIAIEHHLDRFGEPPASLESLYDACDLVITSRFHGGILALRNEVPFIAIDQIRGRGKVTALLGPTGWPFIFGAESANADQVHRAAEELLGGKYQDLLRRIADVERSNALRTLAALEQLIIAEAPSRPSPMLRRLWGKASTRLRARLQDLS
jgi:Capsular polysaccharide synthesis protein/Polysaccharide pyruvyl transferase